MCKSCGLIVASAREDLGTSAKLSMFVVFLFLCMGTTIALSQNYPLSVLGFYLAVFISFYLLFKTYTPKWLFITKTKYLNNLIFVKYVTYKTFNSYRWVYGFHTKPERILNI
jgi:hypothetical protein